VIVGGGIVGAATAFHASRAGLKPLVLEKRPALCTLTPLPRRASGSARQRGGLPADRRIGRAVPQLRGGHGPARPRRGRPPTGYLWLTTTDDGIERQRRLVEAQRSWGLRDVQLLTGDDARREFAYVDPSVRQARFRKGRPHRSQASRWASPRGGRGVVRARVRAFGVPGAGRSDPCRRDLGRPGSHRLVVIAAGPFSGIVAALRWIDLPVQTVRRQKLVLPRSPRSLRVPHDGRRGHRRALAPGVPRRGPSVHRPTTPPTPPRRTCPRSGVRVPTAGSSSPTSVARLAPFWRNVWARGGGHWMLQAGQYTMTPDRPPAHRPDGRRGPVRERRIQRARRDGSPRRREDTDRHADGNAAARREPVPPRSVFEDRPTWTAVR